MTKLGQQAADRGRSLSQLLDILNGTVPEFVAIVVRRNLNENLGRFIAFQRIDPAWSRSVYR